MIITKNINITIEQGATYNQQFICLDLSGNPIDLSTKQVIAQMRDYYGSNNFIQFTSSISNTNIINLSLSANTTYNITKKRYVYDVIVSNTTSVDKMVKGYVNVNLLSTYYQTNPTVNNQTNMTFTFGQFDFTLDPAILPIPPAPIVSKPTNLFFTVGQFDFTTN